MKHSIILQTSTFQVKVSHQKPRYISQNRKTQQSFNTNYAEDEMEQKESSNFSFYRSFVISFHSILNSPQW